MNKEKSSGLLKRSDDEKKSRKAKRIACVYFGEGGSARALARARELGYDSLSSFVCASLDAFELPADAFNRLKALASLAKLPVGAYLERLISEAKA